MSWSQSINTVLPSPGGSLAGLSFVFQQAIRRKAAPPVELGKTVTGKVSQGQTEVGKIRKPRAEAECKVVASNREPWRRRKQMCRALCGLKNMAHGVADLPG